MPGLTNKTGVNCSVSSASV